MIKASRRSQAPKTKNVSLSEIIPALDQMIKETELGVIDYKRLKGEEPDNMDITHRLTELYAEVLAQGFVR